MRLKILPLSLYVCSSRGASGLHWSVGVLGMPLKTPQSILAAAPGDLYNLFVCTGGNDDDGADVRVCSVHSS